MFRKPIVLIAILFISHAITARSENKAPDPTGITIGQLRSFLTFIASDELEGRNTPSNGLNTAARYISTNLLRWGVKPAGDKGSYYQKIDLVHGQTQAKQCKAELDGKPFVYGEDLFSAPVSVKINAGMVYGGSGWLLKSKGEDAYKGLDVKGKIVILNCGPGYSPVNASVNDMAGARGKDYSDPVTYAKKSGAAAIVWIVGKKALPTWVATRSNFESDYNYFQMERFREQREVTIPAIYANEKMVRALFAGEKAEADALYNSIDEQKALPPFELNAGKHLSIEIVGGVKRTTTQNVVAEIEGRDPILKKECVLISAHYDHVGMRGPQVEGQDNVFNGADDDGSGTVSLLSIAETLSKSPQKPKRSVLFIWHCGEEKGLWGSQYYTAFPTMPLKGIVTDLNIDMIGRSKKPGDKDPRNVNLSGPNEIYIIGAKKMSTELGEICDRVNRSYLKLNYNYKYDDPRDPEALFYRSDHYNYALKGIPVAFFFDGVHEDYHQLSDQVEKIDFTKMQKIARTIYLTMWNLAEQTHRPIVDKPLKN